MFNGTFSLWCRLKVVILVAVEGMLKLYRSSSWLKQLRSSHHSATADTWLDVIAVCDPGRVAQCGKVLTFGLSKRNIIFLYKLKKPKSHTKLIHYRNSRHLDRHWCSLPLLV